ncbi:hypothetical protein BGW39_001314, partial [Mortierella sp. 14UC]
MIDIPELFQHISSYLDAKSLLACTLVSRQWRVDFTPGLWQTFYDDDKKFWQRLLIQPRRSSDDAPAVVAKSLQDQQQRLSNLMQTHGQHIRHLKITTEMTLVAALESNLEGLVSLRFSLAVEGLEKNDSDDDSNGDNNGDSNDKSDKKFPGLLTFLAADRTNNLWEDRVPNTAFDNHWDRNLSMEFTRACWRLALLNPGLNRLVVDDPDGLRGARSFTELGVVEAAASESFLVNAMATLSGLQHLELGLGADNFLLCNLTTLLPNLVSFAHIDQVTFDPTVLQLKPAHHSLKELELRRAVLTSTQLRAIVMAFPALTRLSILKNRRSFLYTNEKVASITTMDYDCLEHSSLTSLEIRGQPYINILRSGIRFPRVTEFLYGFIYNSQELQHLFWVFPALERFRTNGGKGKPLSADEAVQESRLYPIRDLYIDMPGPATSPLFTLESVAIQMPFLTRLKMVGGSNIGRTIRELVRTCKGLEDVYLSSSERCSQELVELLVGCPKLRKFCGRKLTVLAKDLIESAEWACEGLEELSIEIVGVSRLSKAQELLLEDLGQCDAGLFASMAKEWTAVVDQEEQQDGQATVEHIRQRLQQYGHKLTFLEAEAL